MNSIRVRLFLSYLLVLLVGMLVMLIAVPFIAPAAYNRHMAEGMMMNGTPMPEGEGMGMGMGRGNGQGPGATQNFSNFRAGVVELMLYATLAALVVAVLVSMYLSRRIVAPLQAMAAASERIAAGRYEERVDDRGADELAQLAARFNQMAEKLESTEALRRRLIGDVSHELRTPLTGIKGYMEGLMDGVLPATPETFDQIHREADRLSRLVDDLQELSRVESGAFSLDVRPASLSALVQTTLKRLMPAYENKEVHLTPSLPADLPSVLADEDRLIQVLTNLLGNALHHTPAAGTVTVSAMLVNGEVQVSVKDTGVGIPARNLPHIFDRFYRADPSRSRASGGGSGIGLTIAKALVEAQGGRIWAESAGEGQGSTFTFTLKTA